MIKAVTRFLLSILTGANVATIIIMLLVGFSDHINPAAHPTLACAGMFFPAFLAANMAFLILWLIIKWQRAWIPVVGFALAYVPIRTYIPLRIVSQPEGETLKVISYNVSGYYYNKDADAFANIKAWLQNEDADIVCLQEDISHGKLQPLDSLKLLYEYNDTVHVNNVDQKYINAIGIHSRYPILRTERISYTSSNNGSAAFFLQVGQDTVIVVNNHLESTHLSPEERQRYKDVLKGDMETDSAREETRLLISKIGAQMSKRAPQADAVHQYIEAHRGRYPIIVCGDFNDTPISYVRRTIAKGLTDCFVEAGAGLGLSYNQKGFFFRIDYILCSDDYQPTFCHVDSKITLSDHYPIVCWLKKVDKP